MELDGSGQSPNVDWDRISLSTIMTDIKKFGLVRTGQPSVAVQETLLSLLYFLHSTEIPSKIPQNYVDDIFIELTQLLHCQDGVVRGVAITCLEVIAPYVSDVRIMGVNSLQKMLASPATRADAYRTLALFTDPGSLGDAFASRLDQTFADRNATPRVVVSAAAASIVAMDGSGVDTMRPFVQDSARFISLHAKTEAGRHLFALASSVIPARERAALMRLCVSASGVCVERPLSKTPQPDGLGLAVVQKIVSLLHQQLDAQTLNTACAILAAYLGLSPKTAGQGYRPAIAAAIKGIMAVPASVFPSERYAALIKLMRTHLAAFLTASNVQRLFALRVLSKEADLSRHPTLLQGFPVSPILDLTTSKQPRIASLALSAYLRLADTLPLSLQTQLVPLLASIPPDSRRADIVTSLVRFASAHPETTHGLMPAFMFLLCDQGDSLVKSTIFEALGTVIANAVAAGDDALIELGMRSILEFVAQCEHGNLAARVLTFIADLVPRLTDAMRSSCITTIFNRIALDDAIVTHSAVSALVQIALTVPVEREPVLELLKLALLDDDDTVRDEAAAGVALLESGEGDGRSVALTIDVTQLTDADCEAILDAVAAARDNEPVTSALQILEPLQRPIVALPPLLPLVAPDYDSCLVDGMGSVGATRVPEAQEPVAPVAHDESAEQGIVATPDAATLQRLMQTPVGHLLKDLCGDAPLIHSATDPLLLTERDLGLFVSVRRHFPVEHGLLLFEFILRADDPLVGFRDLCLNLDVGEQWEIVASSLVPQLYCEEGYAFVLLRARITPDNGLQLPVQFPCAIQFISLETDSEGRLPPRGFGHFDQQLISVDTIELFASDLFRPLRSEEQLDEAALQVSSDRMFSLPTHSPQGTAQVLPDLLNLGVVKTTTTENDIELMLQGVDIFGRQAETVCMLMHAGTGTQIRMTIRATDAGVMEGIVNAVMQSRIMTGVTEEVIIVRELIST